MELKPAKKKKHWKHRKQRKTTEQRRRRVSQSFSKLIVKWLESKGKAIPAQRASGKYTLNPQQFNKPTVQRVRNKD